MPRRDEMHFIPTERKSQKYNGLGENTLGVCMSGGGCFTVPE
jgi:hypothetical protein